MVQRRSYPERTYCNQSVSCLNSTTASKNANSTKPRRVDMRLVSTEENTRESSHQMVRGFFSMKSDQSVLESKQICFFLRQL